jgi:hypothetical protein
MPKSNSISKQASFHLLSDLLVTNRRNFLRYEVLLCKKADRGGDTTHVSHTADTGGDTTHVSHTADTGGDTTHVSHTADSYECS